MRIFWSVKSEKVEVDWACAAITSRQSCKTLTWISGGRRKQGRQKEAWGRTVGRERGNIWDSGRRMTPLRERGTGQSGPILHTERRN